MAGFRYGRAILDSFRLIFDNLYVFVPIILSSVFGLLSLPLYSGLFDSGGNFNLQLVASYPWYLIGGAISFILGFIISFLAYGWIFSLIGGIARNGKANLLQELKNCPRKAWNLFLIFLILMLIYSGLYIILAILLIISGLILKFLPILGVILMVLFFLAWIIGILILPVFFIHVVPLISLKNFGAVETIKLSFKHFRDNKIHSFALIGITFLFMIVSALLLLIILFSFAGFSSDAVVLFMINEPMNYAVVSFFAGLPSIFIMIWGIAFLTIAYARKNKISKI